MIETWKYEGEYSIYDYINEADCLLDDTNWGIRRFAVLDDTNILIGELTTEFFREVPPDSEDDGYVEIDEYNENRDKIYEMWIGFGLKPELTGKGLGQEFVSKCVEFAIAHHDYKGEFLRLGVAEFNHRAIKIYSKVGFEVFDTCHAEISGENHRILWMRKALEK